MSTRDTGHGSGDLSFLAPPGELADWRLVLAYEAATNNGVLDALPGGLEETAQRCDLDERALRAVLGHLRAWGLDLAGLLDVIEADMSDAPDRLQWAMNHFLAQIGVEHAEHAEHAEHRARAIDIGERLEVLKDYPTPSNCTFLFAAVGGGWESCPSPIRLPPRRTRSAISHADSGVRALTTHGSAAAFGSLAVPCETSS